MSNTNNHDIFEGTVLSTHERLNDESIENINSNHFIENYNYYVLEKQNLFLKNENFDLKKQLYELNLKYEEVNKHLSFIKNFGSSTQNNNYSNLNDNFNESSSLSSSTIKLNHNLTNDLQISPDSKSNNILNVSNVSEDRKLLQDYFLYLNRDFAINNNNLMFCVKKNKYLKEINDYIFNLIQKNILKLPIKTICKFSGSINNTTNILTGPYIGRFTHVIELVTNEKKKNNVFLNNISIIENFFKKEIDISKIYFILKNGNDIENQLDFLKSNKNCNNYITSTKDNINNDYIIDDENYCNNNIINFEGKIQNISEILNKLNNKNINYDFDYPEYEYYKDNLNLVNTKNGLNEIEFSNDNFVKIVRKNKNYIGFDIIIGNIFIIEFLFTRYKISNKYICQKNNRFIHNNINKIYIYLNKQNIVNLDNYFISGNKIFALDIIGHFYEDRQDYIKKNLNDVSFLGSEIKNIIRLVKYFITNEINNVNNVYLNKDFIGYTKNNSNILKETNNLEGSIKKKVVSEYFIEILCIQIVKENYDSVINYISNTYKIYLLDDKLEKNYIKISKRKKNEIFIILMMKKIFEFISSRIPKEEINRYLLKLQEINNSSEKNLSYSKIVNTNMIMNSIDKFVFIDPVILNHNICLEEDKQSLLDLILASININNYLDYINNN